MQNKYKNSYNFNKYANHLQSRALHTKPSIKHIMDIDRLCADFENFYALEPNFFVNESNQIMKALNYDYTKYVEWVSDD